MEFAGVEDGRPVCQPGGGMERNAWATLRLYLGLICSCVKQQGFKSSEERRKAAAAMMEIARRPSWRSAKTGKPAASTSAWMLKNRPAHHDQKIIERTLHLLKTLQDLARHKHIATTMMYYVRAKEDAKRNALATMTLEKLTGGA